MDFCGFVADSIRWAKLYYNNDNFIYSQPQDGNKVYLTFDDGPTPGVTHWILETLAKYKAKATFFMIGNNIEKYPDLLKDILSEGHIVGNHTYNHLKGFRHNVEDYIKDVLRTQALLPKDSILFRPPYGRMKVRQAKRVMDLGLKIVLWTVVSCDYERKVSPQRIFDIVQKRIRPGAIIVFHDSLKAQRNMKYALERLLEEYSDIYRFESLKL